LISSVANIAFVVEEALRIPQIDLTVIG